MIRFGLVYGFGGHPRAERVSASFAGLYGGVQIGQSVLASRNVGPHPDTDAPDFILDVPRASSGAAVGAYVGYGWTLGNVRLGGEMDADLTSTFWIIDRVISVAYAYFSGSAAGVARPDFSRSLCSGKPLMLISCLKTIVQYSRAWRSRRWSLCPWTGQAFRGRARDAAVKPQAPARAASAAVRIAASAAAPVARETAAWTASLAAKWRKRTASTGPASAVANRIAVPTTSVWAGTPTARADAPGVNLLEVVFGDVSYTGADTFEAFTQAADDARAVINYVHNYEVPADLQGLRGAATMAAPPPSGRDRVMNSRGLTASPVLARAALALTLTIGVAAFASAASAQDHGGSHVDGGSSGGHDDSDHADSGGGHESGGGRGPRWQGGGSRGERGGHEAIDVRPGRRGRGNRLRTCLLEGEVAEALGRHQPSEARHQHDGVCAGRSWPPEAPSGSCDGIGRPTATQGDPRIWSTTGIGFHTAVVLVDGEPDGNFRFRTFAAGTRWF